MERVTAAVVIHNGRALLPELSRTLSGLSEIPCIIYDSASSDDSLGLIEKLIPGATVLSGPNRGFGWGNNRCIEKTDTEYTLLLNSDASISPDSLAKLVNFLTANTEYAAVQPLIRLWGWELATASRGVYLTEFGEAWDSGFMHLEPFVSQSPLDVPAVTASVALWRTDVLRALGGFDEKFFMYFEDADLSLRARASGWKVAVVTDAVARHMVGASSKRSEAGLWELYSSALMFKRYFGKGSLGRPWLKREARTALWMLSRGKSPLKRLLTAARAAGVKMDGVDIPKDIRGSLFGSPLDKPMPRPERSAPGPGWHGELASPWAAVETTGDSTVVTLESTEHAVTGVILDGAGVILKRFTVPARGSRNYHLATSDGVIYIKCDSYSDEVKAGIQ